MLPSSGRITTGNINTELNQVYSGAQRNLGGTSERGIARKPSGQIALSDFYSRSIVDLTNLPGFPPYSATTTVPVSTPGNTLVGVSFLPNAAILVRQFTNGGTLFTFYDDGWTVDGIGTVDLSNHEITGRIANISGSLGATISNSAPMAWSTVSYLPAQEFNLQISGTPNNNQWTASATADITIRRIGDIANAASVSIPLEVNLEGPPI